MDLDNLSIFGLAHQNMQYLATKQRVVAGNLANVNTPDYLPKDVRKPNFSDELENKLQLNQTNPKHLNVSKKSGFSNEVYTPTPTTPLTIDGNGVVIEDQLNEASKASSEYNRMITIYNKYRTMLRTAMTKINA